MKYKTKVNIFSVAFPLIIGALSSLATSGNMQTLFDEIVKPPLSPPSWLFPVVWSVLFILMGIGSARVYLSPDSQNRTSALYLYLANLFLNFFWSIIFFNFRAFLFAFIWLLALLAVIILMTVNFYKCDRMSGLLQLPYILWVTFAGYLTFAIWFLNK